MAEPVLPNLVIIGATKCGTTSLHHYLGMHPEVFMSSPKELRFFDGHTWDRGVEWYGSRFAGARAPVIGESSPQYSAYPHLPGVPARMNSVIPDAKLIYLVRDPIERLLSHYVDEVSRGRERRPFDRAVEAVADNYAVSLSRYAMQLERFLDHYPLDRILVLDQADLLDRRRETLRRVFGFLGVDAGFEDPRFRGMHNRSGPKRRMRRVPFLLPRAMARTPKPGAPRFDRTRVWSRLAEPLSVPIARPELTPEHRAALSELLAPEADRLRALTDEPFGTWSV